MPTVSWQRPSLMRLGFEEAIMLDPQGYIAECTGENLFVVRHGKIITPSTAPVLEGITRHSIHTIAQDLGYRILEQPISRDQLVHRRRGLRLRDGGGDDRLERNRLPQDRRGRDRTRDTQDSGCLSRCDPRRDREV